MDGRKKINESSDPSKCQSKEESKYSKSHVYNSSIATEKVDNGVSTTSQGLMKGVERPVHPDQVDISLPPSISSGPQNERELRIINLDNSSEAYYR